MKNKHIFIPLFIFLGAGLVSLVAAVIDFKGVNKQLSYSSETIQLNYDGASDGLDPNGRTFDAITFMTDDVIEAAFQKSGLTGENYTADKVKPYIAIENVVPKNIIQEINYYESILEDTQDQVTGKITTRDYRPVRYRFVVYQNLGVSQSKLNEVVDNLANEYIAKFANVYTNTLNSEAYNSLMDFDDYDYNYQTQVLSNEISLITNFASELHARHNDFSVDDRSFKDLIAVGNELLSNLGYINSELIQPGSITKYPEELRTRYNHTLVTLNKQLDKANKDLADATDQLNGYSKDETTHISNGETVITVSNNSGATYDALSARVTSLQETVNQLTGDINRTTQLRDKIDTVTQAQIDNIVARIDSIKTKYQTLENDFKAMLSAYNAKYMHNKVITQTKPVYQSSSLISAAFIVRCIKIGMPIMLSVMLGIAIYYLIRVIKKEKEQPQQIEEQKKAA